MSGVAAEDGLGCVGPAIEEPAVALTASRAVTSGSRQARLGRRMSRYSPRPSPFLPGSVRLVTITPDTKDWTWVLERACPQCGYDASTVPVETVAARLRANAAGWGPVLRRPDVSVRPRPDVWSPLEYACHVRDVHELYLHRLDRMLTESDPLYDNWDQDATALEKDYGAQNPVVVSDELAGAAQRLADRFDTVTGDAWQRRGRRSDGASFTVDTFSRYMLHDVEHHLWDVR